MDQTFQAVFEHGILRPLEPLHLKEDEVISLTIVSDENGADAKSDGDKEQARRQRDLLLAFVKKMESLPDDSPHDGLSNRDHDRLIYGP